MDAIEALDDGAGAFFGFTAKKHPQFLQVMEPAYYASHAIGIAILVIFIVLLLIAQGRSRAALIAVFSFGAAVVLIEMIRVFVPRQRPQDAIIFLGPDSKVGSYPSAGVFLFMLGSILLGNAIWVWTNRAVKAVYIVLSALLIVWICVSQFFLSIHYVTDVIGGMAGAVLIGWIATALMNRVSIVKPPLDLAAPSDAIQDLSHTRGIQPM
jgi:membrane-associated phospholipid phosphatase